MDSAENQVPTTGRVDVVSQAGSICYPFLHNHTCLRPLCQLFQRGKNSAPTSHSGTGPLYPARGDNWAHYASVHVADVYDRSCQDTTAIF